MAVWRAHVTVAGRVVRVRSRRDGGWRVRLADTGGALAAADFHSSSSSLPPIGAWIIIHGPIHFDTQHNWYVVDPVEHWIDAGTAMAR